MKKKCIACGTEKDISEFNKDKSRKDGHDPRCRVCKRKESLEYHYFKNPLKDKWCERCNTYLGLVNSKVRFCPTCRKERDRESNRRHSRRYREKNLEAVKARLDKYRSTRKYRIKARLYARRYLAKLANKEIPALPSKRKIVVVEQIQLSIYEKKIAIINRTNKRLEDCWKILREQKILNKGKV